MAKLNGQDILGAVVNITNVSASFATETQITAKERTDLAISPKNIDHAVRECTHHYMTSDRDLDLRNMLSRVSSTYGPDVGPDPEWLPVSYEGIRTYITYYVERELAKNKPTSKLIYLEKGEEYVLKQNCHYYIHGYGDNALLVQYAEGPNAGKNVLSGIEYVDDIDAEITSTYADQYNYWQMFRCWIRDRSLDKVGRYTDWQQGAWPAIKVKNVYTGNEGTGRAYLFEYGVHAEET